MDHRLPTLPARPDCQACSLHTDATHVGVPSIHLPTSLPPSPTTPVVLFLGRNPGFNEDQQNEPFVGKSGRLLREAYVPGVALQSSASIYLLNAVRCYTVDNTPPKATHYKACLPYTTADIDSILAVHSETSKAAAVALGADAALYLHYTYRGNKAKQKDAFAANGVPSTLLTTRLSLYATYHPAYLLRNPNYFQTVSDHMQLVADYINDITPTSTKPTLTESRPPRREANV